MCVFKMCTCKTVYCDGLYTVFSQSMCVSTIYVCIYLNSLYTTGAEQKPSGVAVMAWWSADLAVVNTGLSTESQGWTRARLRPIRDDPFTVSANGTNITLSYS